MTIDTTTPTAPGGSDALVGDAAMYTPFTLRIYDPIALGLVCPLAWRCSRSTMLDVYDSQISSRHLDVGPGSGFFLDRTAFPTPDPRITLVDLSETVLDTVARRIERYAPTPLVRDVMAPLDLGDARFETAAAMNVLHCLPGTTARKTDVLVEIARWVEPGGRVFGSTVLGSDVGLGRFGSWMMRQYNQAGSFQNTHDSLASLRAALDERFDRWRVWTRGAMAFFVIDV